MLWKFSYYVSWFLRCLSIPVLFGVEKDFDWIKRYWLWKNSWVSHEILIFCSWASFCHDPYDFEVIQHLTIPKTYLRQKKMGCRRSIFEPPPLLFNRLAWWCVHSSFFFSFFYFLRFGLMWKMMTYNLSTTGRYSYGVVAPPEDEKKAAPWGCDTVRFRGGSGPGPGVVVVRGLPPPL